MILSNDIESGHHYYGNSCENGNCNNNPDREAQLFGFLDQFFFQSNEPQESPTTPVDKINSSATPIVIWHGLGQSCCDPMGIGRVKSVIEKATGAYVVSVKIGNSVLDDTINGFFKPVNQQIDTVCSQLGNDTRLAQGYHAIGFSQGGQFLRGLAQRCPNPPMKHLVSMGSQHQGIYGIPKCPGISLALCNLMRRFMSQGVYSKIVQNNLVVAQYWHDTLNYEKYVTESRFIAEINNEGQLKNATYANNLTKLKKFVMVKNLNDSTVIPIHSQHFETYAPGNDTTIVPLRESKIYKEDWIGLKKLDEAGRLVFIDVPGDHIEYDTNWFIETIVKVYLV